MEIISPELYTYAVEHSSEESEILANMTQYTQQNLEYSDMLSGRVVGGLLSLLTSISGAETILEIGTFTGYSALSMAEALPDDGKLFTCEYNEQYEKIARRYFEKSSHGDKIELIMGNAMETIFGLDETFDLVFLDADKVNYPNYYELVLPKIVSGGVLVVDNVFWSGTVVEPEDEKSAAINRLNKMIRDDSRVRQVMLTVRDGLSLVQKL